MDRGTFEETKYLLIVNGVDHAFLTLFHREPTDYVEISKRLYEGQTVEEIFERAKKHWKE